MLFCSQNPITQVRECVLLWWNCLWGVKDSVPFGSAAPFSLDSALGTQVPSVRSFGSFLANTFHLRTHHLEAPCPGLVLLSHAPDSFWTIWMIQDRFCWYSWWETPTRINCLSSRREESVLLWASLLKTELLTRPLGSGCAKKYAPLPLCYGVSSCWERRLSASRAIFSQLISTHTWISESLCMTKSKVISGLALTAQHCPARFFRALIIKIWRRRHLSVAAILTPSIGYSVVDCTDILRIYLLWITEVRGPPQICIFLKNEVTEVCCQQLHLVVMNSGSPWCVVWRNTYTLSDSPINFHGWPRMVAAGERVKNVPVSILSRVFKIL